MKLPIEVHMTVVARADREDALEAWRRARALKLTHIELARGSHPRQAMLTAHLQPEGVGLLDAVAELCEDLRRGAGVDVV